METEHDVFHRADERFQQVLNEINGSMVIDCCTHPKMQRVFIDPRFETFAMCRQCAFIAEADASIDRVCDVCASQYRCVPNYTVWKELDIEREYDTMPGFRGVVVVPVITPCTFSECVAMAIEYGKRMEQRL